MSLFRSLVIVALVLSASNVFAQSYAGTIVGSIKDPTGAVIPHATVTITNQQTDRQETVTADAEGRYRSLPLPPGEYRVEAGLQGFRRAARANITITAQFRIEALNAFNRVQFSAPNTSVTSTSFGVITGQANAPRQLQFGFKLLW